MCWNIFGLHTRLGMRCLGVTSSVSLHRIMLFVIEMMCKLLMKLNRAFCNILLQHIVTYYCNIRFLPSFFTRVIFIIQIECKNRSELRIDFGKAK